MHLVDNRSLPPPRCSARRSILRTLSRSLLLSVICAAALTSPAMARSCWWGDGGWYCDHGCWIEHRGWDAYGREWINYRCSQPYSYAQPTYHGAPNIEGLMVFVGLVALVALILGAIASATSSESDTSPYDAEIAEIEAQIEETKRIEARTQQAARDADAHIKTFLTDSRH